MSRLLGLEEQVIFVGTLEEQAEFKREYPWFQRVGCLPNTDWHLRQLLKEGLSCTCCPKVFLERSKKARKLIEKLGVKVCFYD